jgi:hypothetical protein
MANHDIQQRQSAYDRIAMAVHASKLDHWLCVTGFL